MWLKHQGKRFRRRPQYRPNRHSGKWHLPRFKRFARWALVGIVGLYGVCGVSFLYLKWLPPLTTSVQIQRRIESIFGAEKYQTLFVRLSEIRNI